MSRILVTGATGTVGQAVVRHLAGSGAELRLARRPSRPAAPTSATSPTATSSSGARESVPFDFLDPATWGAAFAGVDTMFLVRPPALGNVTRDLLPAVAAAQEAGVRHVVFLSLQGAERIRVVPHATVETWLRRSGLIWTFVRASFFDQNLSTTHAADIRDRDEIVVPAGRGRTAFVDADDVGAVSAAALLDPVRHGYRAWTVTGPEALSYGEVAEILTSELGRPVRYTRPSVAAYARHAHTRLGMPVAVVAVTTAIYTSARLGLAAGLTDDVATVLGRDPHDFATFAHRERDVWLPVPSR